MHPVGVGKVIGSMLGPNRVIAYEEYSSPNQVQLVITQFGLAQGG